MIRRLSVYVIALAACSGGGRADIPYERLDDELAAAYCTWYSTCGFVRSQLDCNLMLRAFEPGTYAYGHQFDAAVASGRVKYDGASARACFDSYMQSRCTVLPDPSQEDCQRMFVGQVADGQPCQDYFECASETCARVAATCGGVCTARVAEGGAVSSGSECALGLKVIDGTCQRPRAQEEACTIQSDCASGTFCSPRRRCQALRLGGELCDATLPCGNFYACVGGKCEAPPDLGQACVMSRLPACKLDLFCDATTSTCTRRLEVGDTCGQSDACRPPADCIGPIGSRTCTARALEGESCAQAFCTSETWCEPATKTCKKPIAVGAPCTVNDRCVSGSECRSGACARTDMCP